MAHDPYKYFRIEGRELVDQLAKGLLDLEKGPAAAELVARLLRLAHTLKGAARVVKQREIADQAHAIEDALAPFREGGGAVPRERVDSVLKMLDDVAARLAALQPEAEAEAERRPEAARELLPAEPVRTLGADVDEMDALLDGVAEASVQLASLRRGITSLERARRLTELLDEHLAAPRAQQALNGAAPKIRSMAAELRGLVEVLERSLAGGVEQMERELREVREAGERLRLLPARLMFNSLERAARDAGQSLARRIVFAASGGQVRLDANVLGVVQNALVQAVRNAVAHGIEPEAERVRAGKPVDGRVSVDVQRRGNRVAFVCRDDGRGVDLEAVRRAAERKGLRPADTQTLSGEEILRLLLAGGLSTSRTITEISGRGIGLDIVRDAASRLGGEVSVQTQGGVGTTLELFVPVSLSSLDALIVEAGGWMVAIPLESVRRTLRVLPADVCQSSDGASILYDGAVIPFAPLGRALRVESRATAGKRAWSAVVVGAGSSAAAVGVDRIHATENIVLRPLPEHTPADAVVAGTSLDAEGNPQLVLDPEGLVAEARRSVPATPKAAPSSPPILVIDDSLTTRILEQSILESAGYDVDVAVSGEEALEKARARRYALFLVDVEMPGMDGFVFIERTRADPTLRDVPAMLVTSRDSPEDRRRGERVGARAYIVKSEFEQSELLERIRLLVGSP